MRGACCYRCRVSDVNAAAERNRAGLCADCVHAQRVPSSRASIFFLCGRSTSDPAFVKYPQLPVRRCDGYEGER